MVLYNIKNITPPPNRMPTDHSIFTKLPKLFGNIMSMPIINTHMEQYF